MTGDPDVEARLRRHLAAEADELPFLVDAAALHARLGQRRGRWWRPLALVPTAALLVLAVAVGGALLTGRGENRSGGPQPWGPLAVLEMSGGSDALNTGVLRITDRCVVLETAGGESELLVWPADRTRWDEATNTIRFTDSWVGTEFTLRDGEPVSFGGGGDGTAEGGVAGPEWAASLDWVAAPDPSCPMDIRWYVGSVVAQGPEAGAYVIVPSGEFPGVDIACRGELYVEAEACRAWGEELLADSTLAPEGVTLLVLTANAGDARCAADFYIADDEPPAATAAVVCPVPVPAPTGPTPPPLNDLEYRGDDLVIIGPAGEIVARSGDTVGFNYRRDPGMGSFCMAGMPVSATEIVFVDSTDN